MQMNEWRRHGWSWASMVSAIPNDFVSKACSQPVERECQLLCAGSSLRRGIEGIEQSTLLNGRHEPGGSKRQGTDTDAAANTSFKEDAERRRQINVPVTGRIDWPVVFHSDVIAITNRQGQLPADTLLNAQRPAELFKQIGKMVPENAGVVGVRLQHVRACEFGLDWRGHDRCGVDALRPAQQGGCQFSDGNIEGGEGNVGYITKCPEIQIGQALADLFHLRAVEERQGLDRQGSHESSF